MMFLLIVVLSSLASIVPCIVLYGRSPLALVLAPLLTALCAALAAQMEVAFAGGFLPWFLGTVAVVNAAAGLLHFRCRNAMAEKKDRASWVEGWWTILVIAVVIIEVALPLLELRYPLNTVDGLATYYLHTLFISAGHHQIVAALQNPALFFMNQNYPLLDPASQVAAFIVRGEPDARLGMLVIGWLDLCALLVVVVGLVAIVPEWLSFKAKVFCVVILSLFAVVGIALDASYVLSGDADLLWSACAVAAIVYGTLLPRTRGNACVAALGILVIAVTKNEGFVTALFLAAVLVWRYREELMLTQAHRGTVQRVCIAGLAFLVLTAPGLWWELYVIKNHLSAAFFNDLHHSEPPLTRIWPSLVSIGHFLAVGILVVGIWLLAPPQTRLSRRKLGIPTSRYLWLTVLWYLGALMGTYVFGVLEIHYWLLSSTNRTTIFPVLLFFVELSIWFIVALAAILGERQVTVKASQRDEL